MNTQLPKRQLFFAGLYPGGGETNISLARAAAENSKCVIELQSAHVLEATAQLGVTFNELNALDLAEWRNG